jgi:hypothetical protein
MEEETKKKKKPPKWAYVVAVILVLWAIGSIGGKSDGAEDAASTVEAPASVVETVEPSEEPTVEPSPSEEPEASEEPEPSEEPESIVEESSTEPIYTLDDIGTLLNAALAENYDHHSVEVEDGTITINVWNDGIAMATVYAAAGVDEVAESWGNLRESMVNLCNTIQDEVTDMGYPDTPVMLNLVNDQNTDNVLLSIYNGIVLYDATE